MANNKKGKMLHIRVSDKDLERIKSFVGNLELSQSEFCLNAILAAMGDDLEKNAMDSVLNRLAMLENRLDSLEDKSV